MPSLCISYEFFRTRVLAQVEGFLVPFFVGYDNKRLNLPSRCITYEFFKTRVLAQVEGLLVPFLVGYDNKRLNLPSRSVILLSGGSQNGKVYCGIPFPWSC